MGSLGSKRALRFTYRVTTWSPGRRAVNKESLGVRLGSCASPELRRWLRQYPMLRAGAVSSPPSRSRVVIADYSPLGPTRQRTDGGRRGRGGVAAPLRRVTKEKNQLPIDNGLSFLYRAHMPSVYPSRSPASMPAARTVRLARRLAGGMTPAEVARHEGTSEDEILSLLEDERFADLVDYHREERELPEDERERLLIASALAGLQHLADMGDTKALLFLTYEGNRGRHPENRLRRLTLPRPADLPPRFRFFDTSEPLSVAPTGCRCPPRPRPSSRRPLRTWPPPPWTPRSAPPGSAAGWRAAWPRWERAGPGRTSRGESDREKRSLSPRRAKSDGRTGRSRPLAGGRSGTALRRHHPAGPGGQVVASTRLRSRRAASPDPPVTPGDDGRRRPFGERARRHANVVTTRLDRVVRWQGACNSRPVAPRHLMPLSSRGMTEEARPGTRRSSPALRAPPRGGKNPLIRLRLLRPGRGVPMLPAQGNRKTPSAVALSVCLAPGKGRHRS